jgi:hypothetical protein
LRALHTAASNAKELGVALTALDFALTQIERSEKLAAAIGASR